MHKSCPYKLWNLLFISEASKMGSFLLSKNLRDIKNVVESSNRSIFYVILKSKINLTMADINIVEICKVVLHRLCSMDYEGNNRNNESKEQLIFPKGIQSNGDVIRISEQELRLLFVEEFKKKCQKLFYSIETPTKNKYCFDTSKGIEGINIDHHGQSALIDMCIFGKGLNSYNRILNIEFKYANVDIKNIAKDVLKLVKEEPNGAFIWMLDNTDSGTLSNSGKSGVLNKLNRSLSELKYEIDDNNSSVQFIIMALRQETLLYTSIKKVDLKSKIEIDKIFPHKCNLGDITKINLNGWERSILPSPNDAKCFPSL